MLPPTAAPIPLRAFLQAIKGLASANGSKSILDFSEQLKRYFDVKHVFLVSSGKAAIWIILTSLQKLSEKREIIIPAYSSFCLASAAARSGLPVKLCDIDPATLDFDLEKLERAITERTLAVIPVHNYGLVCRLDEIRGMAQSKGAFVIEDAAQAAGASFKNQRVGTLGDAGVLSFGRGKNIYTLGGGAILTDNEVLAGEIKNQMRGLRSASKLPTLINLGAGFGTSLFIRPSVYAIPASIPFLKLGANVFDPDFQLNTFPALNATIGVNTFQNLDSFNQVRMENAAYLKQRFESLKECNIPKPASDAASVYLRFPIVFNGGEKREEALRLLSQKGMGANRSYPTPLNGIAEFRKYLVEEGPFPEAESISQRILTLPTHPYVTRQDMDEMASIVDSL